MRMRECGGGGSAPRRCRALSGSTGTMHATSAVRACRRQTGAESVPCSCCAHRWGAPTSSAGKFIVEMDEGGWMHTYHATVYEAPNGQRIQFRTSGARLHHSARILSPSLPPSLPPPLCHRRWCSRRRPADSGGTTNLKVNRLCAFRDTVRSCEHREYNQHIPCGRGAAASQPATRGILSAALAASQEGASGSTALNLLNTKGSLCARACPERREGMCCTSSNKYECN